MAGTTITSKKNCCDPENEIWNCCDQLNRRKTRFDLVSFLLCIIANFAVAHSTKSRCHCCMYQVLLFRRRIFLTLAGARVSKAGTVLFKIRLDDLVRSSFLFLNYRYPCTPVYIPVPGKQISCTSYHEYGTRYGSLHMLACFWCILCLVDNQVLRNLIFSSSRPAS